MNVLDISCSLLVVDYEVPDVSNSAGSFQTSEILRFEHTFSIPHLPSPLPGMLTGEKLISQSDKRYCLMVTCEINN